MESYVEMHHNEWLLRPPSSTDFTAGPGTFKSSSSLTHRRVAAVAFLVVVVAAPHSGVVRSGTYAGEI